jgi:nicotinate-nucleotide pyrophosphorylase (carboxylating)
MSGIATQTQYYLSIVKKIRPGCRIAATRKTAPGLRALDKKAVLLGGGDPHRWTLSDGILIKDNHLSFTSIPEAIGRAKERSLYQRIEVEVNTPEDAVIAATAGADIIMLDNMNLETVDATTHLLQQNGLRDRIIIEVSGGIDEISLQRFAACDVDVISIGALTHSVRNISVHLDIIRKDVIKTDKV